MIGVDWYARTVEVPNKVGRVWKICNHVTDGEPTDLCFRQHPVGIANEGTIERHREKAGALLGNPMLDRVEHGRCY